jgi:4-alpha-glucanotransferase
VGWFKGLKKGGAERGKVLEYLGTEAAGVGEAMIRGVMTSVADTAIVPMQDWLGLGNEARMNTPGVSEGNWKWRVGEGVLTGALARRMRRVAEVSGRI